MFHVKQFVMKKTTTINYHLESIDETVTVCNQINPDAQLTLTPTFWHDLETNSYYITMTFWDVDHNNDVTLFYPNVETILTCYQDLAAILTIIRQYLRNVELCELRYKC